MKPTTTEELAAAIAAQLPENVDAAMVQQMFAVWTAVQQGDPCGTVRRDPQTGNVYVRVDDSGICKWRVVDIHQGGANIFDLTDVPAALPILFRDEGMVAQETEIAAAVDAAVTVPVTETQGALEAKVVPDAVAKGV